MWASRCHCISLIVRFAVICFFVSFSAEKHHVYLLSNGRISMCGINSRNIEYLAKAINDVVVNVKA